MSDEEKLYEVLWDEGARINLAKMQSFKVNPTLVFKRLKSLLSYAPRERSDGIANFEDFEFNGYYWLLINNVVVVYEVLDSVNKVLVDACLYANTGWAHHAFWGIDPNDE